MTKRTIGVMVIEDSPTIRKYLTRTFNSAPDIRVVGESATVDEALRALETLKPDIISLDVFLGSGSAASLVTEILQRAPVPIVLVSDAPSDAPEVFAALGAGALDFVAKPKPGNERSVSDLLGVIRALSRVKVRKRSRTVDVPVAPIGPFLVVGICASTGGPVALRDVLVGLHGKLHVPVVVAQHIAEGYEVGLAHWLASETGWRTCVAENGLKLEAGLVILGRSGCDFSVQWGRVQQTRAPSAGYHPSGDVLLTSLASSYKAQAVAVVLSGIGNDGTAGASKLVAAGGVVFAQSQQTSAVYGMPAAVTKAGLCYSSAAPAMIAQLVVQLSNERDGRVQRDRSKRG
jgi:two-component system chemotaxis response regulator CheB